MIGSVVRHNHPSTPLRDRDSRESSESRFRQLEKDKTSEPLIEGLRDDHEKGCS